MKTARQLIKEIKVNSANAEHIAKTGQINGSLLIDLERAFDIYANDKVIESLQGMSKDVYESRKEVSGE